MHKYAARRKFAQICNLNRILHKYAAWIKFAQKCSKNESLHKYEARMEICHKICSQNQNLHKYATKMWNFLNVLLWSLTIHIYYMWSPNSVLFALSLTICEISANLSFLNFQKCFAVILDNIYAIPNFCPFRSISNCLWHKCKFMLLKLMKFSKMFIRFALSLTVLSFKFKF